MADRITPSNHPGHAAAEYNVTYHVNEARQWLDQLTYNQRVEAFSMLVNGYCEHCGCKLVDDDVCYCTNDE